MNRRSFLRLLGFGAASAAVAPLAPLLPKPGVFSEFADRLIASREAKPSAPPLRLPPRGFGKRRTARLASMSEADSLPVRYEAWLSQHGQPGKTRFVWSCRSRRVTNTDRRLLGIPITSPGGPDA